MRAAYDGLVEVVGLATLGYVGLLQESVGGHPAADEIFGAFGEALTMRWFDQESGRYARPEPAAGIGSSIQRFHGYR